ncbi:MAG: flagellar basal-body rod protein FlgF [Lachnospiraceae bacterium]|nr:flagellar basal-body rod protein FlgF [Lachnospiraceae bacterium]
MLKGLYVAYTGMIQEQKRMDNLANNLANADTTGFKKEGLSSQTFETVLVDKIRDDSEPPRTARRIGEANPGVKIGESYVDWSEGSFQVTEIPLDLAIGGKGFFTVEFTNKAGDKATFYTRDGNLQLTTDGYLVTTDGDYVLGGLNGGAPGRIKLDPTQEITIDQQGYIFQDGKAVSQIKLTDFEDYNFLEHYGENYYYPVDGATEVEATGKLFQGYLETSNVSVVSEMVEMISVSRQYEANQKVIQTYDTSLQTATQLGRLNA